MEYKSFLAGSIAGITGLVGSHPFDTIRVRIQTTGKYQYLGVKDLYKGIGPPAFGVVAEKTVVFGTYESTRKFLRARNFNQSWTNILSGCIAGAACSLIVTPVDRIKINLQEEKRANSSLSIAKGIVRNNGLSSLYKGFLNTLWREVPGYALYLSMYQHIKDRHFGGTMTPMVSFFTGALTGCAVWTVIYPADAIKTRMQSTLTEKKYKNSLDFFRKSFQSGGVRSIYVGLPLALLRAVPLHAGVILGYESSLNIIN
jgi:solute carrier family 25 (mitochondrial carnitine/acylcarnitine transporter), member 20/29